MAMNTKGSRKIVVDDVAYLWRVRHKPTYTQECFTDVPATASVVLDAEHGQRLHITFDFVRCDSLLPSLQPSQAITPKIIADCIQKAQAQGWQTHGKGVFEYWYETNFESL